MAEYTEALRAKMVRKMLPPGAVSANALASETGLSQTTLSRWLKEARTVGVMDKPAKRWTPAEKLRVVVEASQLRNEDLGEFLRREGLHEAQLREWRAVAVSAFAAMQPGRLEIAPYQLVPVMRALAMTLPGCCWPMAWVSARPCMPASCWPS